jgi:hypothetical protein
MTLSSARCKVAGVKRVVVQISFEEGPAGSRPVAASTKRRGTGPRVTVEVEREVIAAWWIFVLYRMGAACVVIAGSVYQERIEAALANLGTASAAYRIVRIPVEDGGGATAFS